MWLTAVLVLSLLTAYAQRVKPTPSPSPPESQLKDQDRIYEAKEVDVKAKLKDTSNQPQPGRDCFEFDYSLFVVLKIVLHKSGIVSEVTLIRKSGCSYDQEAMRAARNIKFVPAKKDGGAVSQYLRVHYEYVKR